MKKLLVFIIPVTIVVLAAGFFLRQQKTVETEETALINEVEEVGQEPPREGPPDEEQSGQVPLPQQEDIIRAFFGLINEKRIPEAIAMMDKIMVGDDSSKQAWGVQFNSLSGIEIEKIEPSMKEEWTDTAQSYRVDLTLKVDPSTASAPIPYYGWENGKNIRWVGLNKNAENLWRIAFIGTGP